MFAELASGAASGAVAGASVGGPYGAAIGGILGGVGGALSGDSTAASAAAARRAAALQAQSAKKGVQIVKNSRDTSVGYLRPYSQTGVTANTTLSDALGLNGRDAQSSYYDNFQTDPGYLATRDAGISGIESNRASSGLLRSGGTLKALQDYGMRLMQGQYQDRLNKIAGLNTQGQNAAAQEGQFTTTAGNEMATLKANQGTALASGVVGAANANTAGTQNMLNMAGYGAGIAARGGNDLANYFGQAAKRYTTSYSMGHTLQ